MVLLGDRCLVSWLTGHARLAREARPPLNARPTERPLGRSPPSRCWAAPGPRPSLGPGTVELCKELQTHERQGPWSIYT